MSSSDHGQKNPSTEAGAAYKAAGVDIDAGEAVVDGIKGAVKSTFRPEVLSEIGGFGGLFAVPRGIDDPVLVSGTDGVGTKLLVAQRVGQHASIGIDLVAMCVNDVVVTGAEPLFFLDYFATGKLEPHVAVEVVKGIAEGCRQAGCALIGGETAEMPGMYGPGHYDLAGFSVGIVSRRAIIDGSRIEAGDVLVGVPSSGLHSNGYSLVRSLVDELDWSEEHGLGAPLGEVLLTPTRIYVRDVKAAQAAAELRGIVHITGGGFTDNIPRILPEGLGAELDRSTWEEPGIFGLLRDRGGLGDGDMYRTFNCGIGLVLVVAADQAQAAVDAVDGARIIGKVTASSGVVVR